MGPSTPWPLRYCHLKVCAKNCEHLLQTFIIFILNLPNQICFFFPCRSLSMSDRRVPRHGSAPSPGAVTLRINQALGNPDPSVTAETRPKYEHQRSTCARHSSIGYRKTKITRDGSPVPPPPQARGLELSQNSSSSHHLSPVFSIGFFPASPARPMSLGGVSNLEENSHTPISHLASEPLPPV